MYFPSIKPLILFLPCVSVFFTLAQSYQCTDKFFELVQERNMSKCQKLPTLAAELGWSNPSPSGNNHHVVHILFGAPLDEEKGWLAWGINPGSPPQMVGTRAAIGIKDSNSSLYCKSYNITYETRFGCRLRPSELEEVKCTRFEFDKSTEYHIFSATLNLSSVSYNVSRLSIVWQIGYHVEGDEPKKHIATLQNVDSFETLNLVSGECSGVGDMMIRLRKLHGIMNIIGWGTLLPVGVIIARFFRKFPFEGKSWWFYLHVGCQSAGFLIGVIGWGLGLWLGHASTNYVFSTHRIFATLLFSFTTLQVLAIWFRPNLDDDYRKLWDIYHHFLGYALLAIIFTNIFEGLKILKPETESWRWAVIGIMVALGSITVILEIHTWRKFIDMKNKSKKSTTPPEEEDHVDVPLH